MLRPQIAGPFGIYAAGTAGGGGDHRGALRGARSLSGPRQVEGENRRRALRPSANHSSAGHVRSMQCECVAANTSFLRISGTF